jgi:hypothetical protein
MAKFAEGLKTLFTGQPAGDNADQIAAQNEQIAKQRETQSISLANQKQQLQQQEGEADKGVARASRTPRGRRLLLASTGETGLSNKLGG